MNSVISSPAELLLPYQRDWVYDESRWKIWLAARQIGKSFGGAAEVVMHSLSNARTEWLIVSAGERQALGMFEKVKQWLEAVNMVAKWETITDNVTRELKCAEARLDNGSKITAIPANPDTARGYSANLLLDEFAFHRDPSAMWRAVLPAITNPLRGDLLVRILSTPNGKGGQGLKFYELWSGGDPLWSRHETSIYDAKAQGLDIDLEQLRAGIGDPEGWAQEYECQFLDSAGTFLSYELIARCEESTLPVDVEASDLTQTPPAVPGSRFVGIDLGTSSDPTVCTTMERRADGRLWAVESLLIRGMDLTLQKAWLIPRIAGAARVAIDATGIGKTLAQDFVRQFGGKVLAVDMTSPWKAQHCPELLRAFQDRSLAIPANKDWREDLHAVQVTYSGARPSYWAPRNADGHSDRFSALLLANAAANAEGGYFTPVASRDNSSLASTRRPLRRRKLPAL